MVYLVMILILGATVSCDSMTLFLVSSKSRSEPP